MPHPDGLREASGSPSFMATPARGSSLAEGHKVLPALVECTRAASIFGFFSRAAQLPLLLFLENSKPSLKASFQGVARAQLAAAGTSAKVRKTFQLSPDKLEQQLHQHGTPTRVPYLCLSILYIVLRGQRAPPAAWHWTIPIFFLTGAE